MPTKVASLLTAAVLLVMGFHYLLRAETVQKNHLTEQSKYRWAVAWNPFSNYRMSPLFLWSVRAAGAIAIVMAVVILWAILGQGR